jgi:hypothetical protein
MDIHGLTPLSVIVVPDWIYRKVIRNKLNTIDLKDYTKMRSILSVDDLAEWFYLNDRFGINKQVLSNKVLESNWHNISTSQLAEVMNSVLPLSGSEEIAHSANTKLQGSNSMSDSYYKFIVIDTTIYVVLSEGLMTHLQTRENMSMFIENYLKQCYAMASVSDVSKLSIFQLYLKQFAI